MVDFNEEKHEYLLNGEKLISVTSLLHLMGIGQNYNEVNPLILNNKAEYGRLVHKEIEEYIKTGEVGFTNELQSFILKTQYEKITPIASELIVNDNILAGTIDMVAKDKNGSEFLVDFKTTRTLNIEYVSWQLSIYCYLYNKQFNKNITKGYVYWFNGTNGELTTKEVEIMKTKKVEELIKKYLNGDTTYQEPTTLEEYALNEIEKAQNKIDNLMETIEKYKELQEQFKETLLNLMQENQVLCLKTDKCKITRVLKSTKKKFELEKFKAENEELYKKYCSEKETAEYLKITFKKEKKE